MEKKRRYLQGTLDFHCGIYSVINALACLRGIGLQTARTILAESVLALQNRPELLRAFLRNETDHYWMVAYCLARWTRHVPFGVSYDQLYGEQWVPDSKVELETILDQARPFLPEKGIDCSDKQAEKKILDTVWQGMEDWLRPNNRFRTKRAVIFRFHYYLRGEASPLVSHWTTSVKSLGDVLLLHDASANEHAIHSIEYEEMLVNAQPGANAIRIVPESVVLLCT